MKKYRSRLIAATSVLIFLICGVSGQNELTEPGEKYMNDRQQPEKVLQMVGVKPGMTIGEIGAGRGRFTVLLAKQTGIDGKVLANDIDETSLAYLRGRCKRLGIRNVQTIVGENDNPLFPDRSLDMAIMVLVYHMIENPDELLTNLKTSLKPGAKLIILDPRDEEIDREFGIDRSKTGTKVPTIRERIQRTAGKAGYELINIETFLPHDYIFILKPKETVQKKPAGELIRASICNEGIGASVKLFNEIKIDTAEFEFSEKTFSILGYEFIGSRSFPEAIAVLNMGIELYPKSSRLYGEIGELYLLAGEKEKARTYYRLYIENGPDSLNSEKLMQSFDMMYEQMRQQE